MFEKENSDWRIGGGKSVRQSIAISEVSRCTDENRNKFLTIIKNLMHFGFT